MPFILNLATRAISEIARSPADFRFLSVIFEVNLLNNWHYQNEYEYKEIRGLYDELRGEIIVQTRDEAWDLEYSTRECEKIQFRNGYPNPVSWSFKPLWRQNALTTRQWDNLLLTLGGC